MLQHILPNSLVPVVTFAPFGVVVNKGDRPGAQLVTDHYELYTTLRDAELIDAVARMLETAFAHAAGAR